MQTVTRWMDAPEGALLRSAGGDWAVYRNEFFVVVKPKGAEPGKFHRGCSEVTIAEAERFARMRHPGAWGLPATVVGVAPTWTRESLIAAELEWMSQPESLTPAERIQDADSWVRRGELRDRFTNNAATVWWFGDAPAALQALSTAGGDEDWLVLWPRGSHGASGAAWVPWQDRLSGSDTDLQQYALPCGALVVIGSH